MNGIGLLRFGKDIELEKIYMLEFNQSNINTLVRIIQTHKDFLILVLCIIILIVNLVHW
nr:MAG TPA: hypothetical protein [Caudoviricetes sp.]